MSTPRIHPVDFTGAKVVGIRHATRSEMQALAWGDDWHHPATVIVLDNGAVLIPSEDMEGNGPGAFFERSGGNTFQVFVQRVPPVEIVKRSDLD